MVALPDTLSIGEVSARTGVATSALRFYEQRGLISSDRTDGNQRRFPRSVIRRVSVIRAAQRCGLTLGEIGTALESLPTGRDARLEDWQRMSGAWREQLDERIESLRLLRDQLTGCIGCGCLSLDRCDLLNPDDQAARLGSGPRYL